MSKRLYAFLLLMSVLIISSCGGGDNKGNANGKTSTADPCNQQLTVQISASPGHAFAAVFQILRDESKKYVFKVVEAGQAEKPPKLEFVYQESVFKMEFQGVNSDKETNVVVTGCKDKFEAIKADLESSKVLLS